MDADLGGASTASRAGHAHVNPQRPSGRNASDIRATREGGSSTTADEAIIGYGAASHFVKVQLGKSCGVGIRWSPELRCARRSREGIFGAEQSPHCLLSARWAVHVMLGRLQILIAIPDAAIEARRICQETFLHTS